MNRKSLLGFAVGFSFYLVCVFAFADSGGISVRFTKMDANGVALGDSALTWDIVRDNTTGLYWEVKTADESLNNKNDRYKWSSAKKNFISELNKRAFGGFSDWRIPTSDEMSGLIQKGGEPLINTDYFPNTEPSDYLSWRLCGSGEITTEKVSFGSTKIKGKNKFIRAVRGDEAE